MEASKFSKELQQIFEQLKKDGIDEIKTENLIRFFSDQAKGLDSANAIDIERYKAELQRWLEEHKNYHAHSVEMFRSVITAGQSALHTSFLMNGGSSVAMLTFISRLATNTPNKVQLFASSLTIFVIGVLVAALATGTTYLSQWFYAKNKACAKKTGLILNIAAILLGIGSYVVFAYGIREAFNVFRNFT
jgi:hypothetical protein